MLEFLTDAQVVTVLVTALVVGLVVVFHYEVIQQLNRWCPNHPSRTAKHRHRPIILATMFVLLFAHIIEIWLFGVAFWGLLSQTGYGYISGYEHISLLDSVYFSAATYTTVGWGDLAATGHIRFLAGTEAFFQLSYYGAGLGE